MTDKKPHISNYSNLPVNLNDAFTQIIRNGLTHYKKINFNIMLTFKWVIKTVDKHHKKYNLTYFRLKIYRVFPCKKNHCQGIRAGPIYHI